MARHLRTPKTNRLPITDNCTALYIRVSTDKQANEGYSLDAQRAKLDAYCFAQGWQVCAGHVYIDAGESGKTTDRPAFDAMMAAARAGQVGRIVAIKLDRVARNVRLFLALVDELQAIGVDLVLLAEAFDTGTPNGKFALTVFAALAELERSTITERMLSGKRQKASQGGYNGSAVPYGYTYTDGKFTINADAADHVRGIFRSYLAGVPMAHIAQRLNDARIPSPTGRTWSTAGVRWILRNGAYAGLAQWDGVEATEGVYPSIVARAEYENAMRIAAATKRGRRPQTAD